MNTSIIIPVYNGERFLRPCLLALQAQTGGAFDILAVDNGSSDASADLIATEFPQVRLIRVGRPLGFAGAVNRGIRTLLDAEQPPDVIVLLNQDTEVDPGWLRALLAPLADPQIGIAGSLARFPDGRIQHAGGALTNPLGYGYNLAAGQPALPLDLPTPDFMAFMATALRTSMLQNIGLLDERFGRAYFEDADLCLRAHAAGWHMKLAVDATLIHYEGAQSATSYRHAALLERNRLRLALKHRAPTDLLGPFLEAERAQLLQRANAGDSQVLRQAYLNALLTLPEINTARRFPPETSTALAEALAELRDTATDRERASRMRGLEVDAPARDLPAHITTSHPPAAITPSTTRRPPFITGHSPAVSIIMLTWNGIEYTRACLESLRANTSADDYHLVIVDNGSTDGTREWLRTLPGITLIENTTNAGFTRGNNQGMAIVPPDHDVLLLNNDTLIIQEGWLACLRDLANSHADYGIVGCTLFHTNGLLQHTGTYIPNHNYWGYQIGGGETYIGQYPGVREVEGITGACMYIRRDVRATIGRLDEAFFSYYEDTDYCLRAIQAGFKIVCTGDVQVIHHENTSSKVNRADWRAMFNRAQALFLNKWRSQLEKRYTHKLFWHSLIAAPTGYATSSRELVLELDRRNVDIRLGCIFGTDYTEPPTGDPRIDQMRSRPKDTGIPQVVYSQADAFTKNSGRYRIGFTMLEADGLPEDWVNQANQMDEIWTPTHWGAEVFAASGVRRPIHVVPLGFDPDHFHPGIHGRRLQNRFVFLSIFDWIERKAPELLLRAYRRAFRPTDDVVLILKVSNTDPYFNLPDRIAELTSGPGPAIVIMANQEIAPHQMASLYRSADCFVLPTRGEGWGMTVLEAMACGIPAISTAWGAQNEFFHAGVGYPLRVRGLVPAVARSPYYAGLRWADPDEEHLVHLLRYAYEHPDETRILGMAGAQEATRWTWARAVDHIMERLVQIETSIS